MQIRIFYEHNGNLPSIELFYTLDILMRNTSWIFYAFDVIFYIFEFSTNVEKPAVQL